MRKSDIENWALRIVERIDARQPIEDARVELKSEWIKDPARAARRLAGHANASRGEPILWLVGVDEQHGVVGADYSEFGSWLSAVRAQFDAVSPDCIDVNVPFPDKGVTIAALYFDTERAPFVIKNPAGGAIQFEVPWRDATAVRSARRADLLKMLVPLRKLPSITVLYGGLKVQRARNSDSLFWRLDVAVYVVPHSEELLVIPRHTSSVKLVGPATGELLSMRAIVLAPQSRGFSPYQRRTIDGEPLPPTSMTIQATLSEALIILLRDFT